MSRGITWGTLALATAIGLAAHGGAVGRTEPTADAETDRLLATGQTAGYSGNLGARADGNRDDGDLIRGRLPDYGITDVTVPTTQADNVVIDRNTGLMWLRDLAVMDGTDGQGARGNVALDRLMPWTEAIDAAAALEYAGHDDWRLPTFHELHTLIDFGRADPTLDLAVFGDPLDVVENRYTWTSTSVPTDAESAYYINLIDGHGYRWTKDGRYVAWPVRDIPVADPVAVPRTGQQTSHHPGDDGDLRPGLAADYAFADDGTIDTAAENLVVDRHTGLEWLRDLRLVDGSGGSVALAAAVDWQTAVERCDALEYAGHDDWHLPNIRELASITQPGRPGGPLDDAAFPGALPPPDPSGVPAIWWSSTSAISGHTPQPPGHKAWFFTAANPTTQEHVGLDFVPAKSRPGYARCVRDAVPSERHPLFVEEVRSSADFESVTVESARPEIFRQGKYLLADVGADVPFDAAFQDVSQHPLHFDFLRAAFRNRYGALTTDDYVALVSRRATRTMFAGGIRSFTRADGERVYGFDVYIGSADDDELLTADETAEVHKHLSRAFRRRPLVYSPVEPAAVERAMSWVDPPVPVELPQAPPEPDYEAYTTGEAFGTVRLMTVVELLADSDRPLSRQDILVLDRSPTDLEGVVAGLVTGSRQGELSHLGVRAARRGTPNAYVAESHARFRAVEGRLVRLTVGRDQFAVDPDVTRAEAEAWWAAHRPSPVPIPEADTAFGRLDDLAAVAAGDADDAAARRVGAKAANLARLYVFLPPEHRVPGLAIPFRYYADFMATNTIVDNGVDPPVERTLAEHVARLHADERFLTDPAHRAEVLSALRRHMRDETALPAGLEAEIAVRIDEVFGSGTMVRFRSSSNAEDGLVFNGAGLYDSTSVCVADSFDDDDKGPSRCDRWQNKERTIGRGLRKVWASLWSFGAWEERDYFGIDHMAAAMALLVTPAFPDERANGVAFTGVPADPDAVAYLVNAQDGDTSVVLPDPGVLPERDLLTVEDGRVTGIIRLQPSNLVPDGATVLSDDELLELGDVLTLADERFPVDSAGHDPADIMLDLEFKIRRADNGLIVKQIRPFLAGAAEARSTLRLEVPAPLDLCATWRENQPLREVYEAKLVAAVEPGSWEIPLDEAGTTHDVLGALRVGPGLMPAQPLGPGRVAVTPWPNSPEWLTVELARDYELDGRPIELRLRLLLVRSGEVNVRELDAVALLSSNTFASATVDEAPRSTTLLPCGLPSRQVERVAVGLEDSQRVALTIHKGNPMATPVGGEPAELVAAEVELAAGRADVGDYPHLVYTAGRHNWSERMWALLDPPLGDAHGIGVYQNGARYLPEDYTAELLDADLAPLRPLAVISIERSIATITPTPTPEDGTSSATPSPTPEGGTATATSTPTPTQTPDPGRWRVYVPRVAAGGP